MRAKHLQQKLKKEQNRKILEQVRDGLLNARQHDRSNDERRQKKKRDREFSKTRHEKVYIDQLSTELSQGSDDRQKRNKKKKNSSLQISPRRNSETSAEFNARTLRHYVKQQNLLSGKPEKTENFMEMKSKQVIEKPRIDQYIHELSHKPIDVKQRLKV